MTQPSSRRATRLDIDHAHQIVAALHDRRTRPILRYDPRARAALRLRRNVHTLIPNVAEAIDEWVRWGA